MDQPNEELGVSTEQELETQLVLQTVQIQALKDEICTLKEALDKQKRLKNAYKMQAANLGDYLKLCLQALREKEIEEGNAQESPSGLTEDSPNSSKEHHSRLSLLKQQAQESGWYISEDEIELQEKLGSGATSDIYKAVWHGLNVAVKCIRPEFFLEQQGTMVDFCQEVELLSRTRHPNVVQFLGACFSPPSQAWIVMELLSSGTVTEWLHGGKKRSLTRTIPLPPLHERLQVAIKIALGMQYLHERNPKVIHRDLKPSNVFLDENQGVRIADFGFAKFLRCGESVFTGETGTYVYMAPEVVRHEPYDEKSDIYSFGVLLCELITGVPPYLDTHLTPTEIAFGVARGPLRPTLPSLISSSSFIDKELIDLVKSTWEHQPTKRPSFANITSSLKTMADTLLNKHIDIC